MDIITAASSYVIGPLGNSVDCDWRSKKLAVAHELIHPNENDTKFTVSTRKKVYIRLQENSLHLNWMWILPETLAKSCLRI